MPDSNSERFHANEALLAQLLGEPKASDDAPQREGLPAGYRMLADSPYVESLDAPVAELRIETLRLDEIDVSQCEPVAHVDEFGLSPPRAFGLLGGSVSRRPDEADDRIP